MGTELLGATFFSNQYCSDCHNWLEDFYMPCLERSLTYDRGWFLFQPLIGIGSIGPIAPSKSAPQILGKLLSHATFFVGVVRFLPTEGLVEKLAMEVEAGFNQIAVGCGSGGCPGVL
jgi:hypothetical protein